jgi:hypothetical protein
MKKADQLELELRRENLLRKTARLRDVKSACAIVARASARHVRLAHVECNGLPQKWDAVRREWEVGLTVAQSEKIDAEMLELRRNIEKELRAILTPGLEYDFQNDSVYCTIRIRDKKNRHAVSIA